MQSSSRPRAQPPPPPPEPFAPASLASPPPPALSDPPDPPDPPDPQTASPFFTRLPSEIRRMIYVEVWRTFGGDEHGQADGHDDGDDDSADDGYPRRCAGGNLSPHITAALAPAAAWTAAAAAAEAAADLGGDNLSSPSQPSPWTPGTQGFTSAPCFLATDDEGRGGCARPPVPPEAHDVRPARLAAAHADDLGAATDHAENNSNGGFPAAAPWPSSSVWRARWNSPWLGHWACEEYFSGAAAVAGGSSSSSSSSSGRRRRRPPLRRPYLPVLLTCRRAHAEGVGLLYSALTFQFTDMATAQAFLARWPSVASVRLVVKLSSSLLDFYRRAAEDEEDGGQGRDEAIVVGGEAHGPLAMIVSTLPRPGDRGGTVVDARNNVWQRLCAGLGPARLPRLRRLHVWVEAHDLRGWHRAAAETRLFAQLLEVWGGGGGGGRDGDADKDEADSSSVGRARRLARDNFVLYLPALPADAAARGLPGCYLGEEDEGEKKTDGKGKSTTCSDADHPPAEAALPCTLVRTERPDYWDVHLNMRPVFVNRRLSIGSRMADLRRSGFMQAR